MKRMVRRAGIGFFYMYVCLALSPCSASTIVRDLRFEEPAISAGDLTCLVTVEACPVLGEPGKPLLPSYPLKVLLPQGEKVVKVNVTIHEESTIGIDKPIEWGQTQAPRSMTDRIEVVAADPGIYEDARPFPQDRAVHVTTQTYRGYDIAYLRVYPVQYVGAEDRILFASRMTVTVEAAPDPSRLERSARMLRRTNPADLIGLERILDLTPSQARAGEKSVSPIALEETKATLDTYTRADAPRPLYGPVDPGDSYPLVIITTSTAEPAFETLKGFKDSRGLTTRVIRVQQITPYYDGVDLADRIRNFIRDAYLFWETEYVLLGADVAGIPHRGLYAEILPYVTDDDIPADIYYACLDGTWNDDGDSRWGEPGEDDLLPEIGIGRVSVDSLTEATNFVNKVMRYESAPVVGQIKTAWMAGELIYDEPTWGGDEKDEVKDGSSAHGFTTAGIPPSYTVGTLYDRDLYPDQWSKWDLIELLNAGCHLVNHSGHCNTEYCMKLWTSDIASGFTNDGISNSYLVIYAHGCYSAAFDNRTTDGSYVGDAVGEYFTLVEDGAVAYVGNSRYGCGFHGDTRAAAQYYDRQFFDAIFGEGITVIGDTQTDSKIDNIAYIDFRGMRWTYYTLNLLADPSMDIWTDTPATLSTDLPGAIFTGDNQIEIGVSAGGIPVPGARVTLFTDSSHCGHAFTDATGLAHVDPGALDPGPVYAAVTAHNFYARLDTLVVLDPVQPLVILEGFTIDDDGAGSSTGNSDGMADAGETIETKVYLRNAGQETAVNMSGVLRTSDPFLSFLDSAGTFADLPGGEVLTPGWSFVYIVDAACPDGHVVPFELEVAYSDTAVTRYFTIPVHAPCLAGRIAGLSDSLLGNGDGCAGPGETLELRLLVANTGSGPAAGVSVRIAENDAYASLGPDSAFIDLIPAGGWAETSPAYRLTLSQDCPRHHIVTLDVEMVLESSRTAGDTAEVAIGGALDDDFEGTVPAWTHMELIPGFYDQWHVETYRNHTPGGAYSWKFGGAGADPYVHYGYGALVTPEICLGPGATMTFWHWIQAELETGDYASDGGIVEISTDGGLSWSRIAPVGGYPYRIYPGTSTPIPPETPCFAYTAGWTQEQFDLASYQGPAQIRFTFGGGEHFESEEGWYLDDVVITDEYASIAIGEDGSHTMPAAFGIWKINPNPTTSGIALTFDVPEPSSVGLLAFDARGRRVGVIAHGYFNPGRHSVTWQPPDGTAPGVYFVRMTAPGFGQTRKVVLLRSRLH